MLPKAWLKRKGIGREALQPLVVPAIVVLVGLSAFALGRLSALASGSGSILPPATNEAR